MAFLDPTLRSTNRIEMSHVTKTINQLCVNNLTWISNECVLNLAWHLRDWPRNYFHLPIIGRPPPQCVQIISHFSRIEFMAIANQWANQTTATIDVCVLTGQFCGGCFGARTHTCYWVVMRVVGVGWAEPEHKLLTPSVNDLSWRGRFWRARHELVQAVSLLLCGLVEVLGFN